MVKMQIEHFVPNARQGWVYSINWTRLQYHGILRNIQLGISLQARNQVLMNTITIITIMCPYLKRNTSMLKYWVYSLSMFPHTLFIQKPISRPSARSYDISKQIWGREKEKRKRGDHPREPCPTLLHVLLSTSTPLLWVIRPCFDFKSFAISYTIIIC